MKKTRKLEYLTGTDPCSVPGNYSFCMRKKYRQNDKTNKNRCLFEPVISSLPPEHPVGVVADGAHPALHLEHHLKF